MLGLTFGGTPGGGHSSVSSKLHAPVSSGAPQTLLLDPAAARAAWRRMNPRWLHSAHRLIKSSRRNTKPKCLTTCSSETCEERIPVCIAVNRPVVPIYDPTSQSYLLMFTVFLRSRTILPAPWRCSTDTSTAVQKVKWTPRPGFE